MKLKYISYVLYLQIPLNLILSFFKYLNKNVDVVYKSILNGLNKEKKYMLSIVQTVASMITPQC